MMQKKRWLTGILGLTLVFGLMVSGCPTEPDDGSGNPIPNNPNTPENPDNPGNPNDSPNSSKNIAVYMEKPAAWSQVYAYVWDDGGTEYTGSGSGTVLTEQSGGYYSFQAKDVENGYINVRFSDGGSHSSLDILDVETDTYYKSAGAFSGDNTKITLAASSSGSFTAPALTAVPATTTVTLNWTLIPDADGYVMYDEFVEFDEDEEEIPDSEYWHFQKILPREQTSYLDDNYGEYLEAANIYTWKLVAVKFNGSFEYSDLAGMEDDDLDEEAFSENYTVLYDFGIKEVETLEGTLPAPTGLKILEDELTPTSVALQWEPVDGAGYYMVWWWNDGSDGREEGWYYIEAAFDPQYVDADEEFIFPQSTYKYKVEARADDEGDGPLYGKWSSEVSVTTPPEVSMNVLALEGGLSKAAAKVKSQIPTPPAPTLTLQSSGKVRVTMAGSKTKYRKFQICDIYGNAVTTPFTGKQSSFSRDISFPAGTNVSLYAIEKPYGSASTSLYSTNNYIDSSPSAGSSPVFVPPKLNITGSSSTAGTGKNAVKTIKLTITGWPQGAPNHSYVTSSSPSGLSGAWSSNNTYTGTIKTSSKVTVTVTPYVNGKPLKALKTGKL
ncbi:MAG: starch-binding protein [Treponema sp.]|jgi:hypothetical protein|nr:starch-binding protein [Treponema sp.]